MKASDCSYDPQDGVIGFIKHQVQTEQVDPLKAQLEEQFKEIHKAVGESTRISSELK